MKFAFYYHIEPKELSMDYRPPFITFLHQVLEKEDRELTTQLYKKGRVKPFTFSLVFSRGYCNKAVALSLKLPPSGGSL